MLKLDPCRSIPAISLLATLLLGCAGCDQSPVQDDRAHRANLAVENVKATTNPIDYKNAYVLAAIPVHHATRVARVIRPFAEVGNRNAQFDLGEEFYNGWSSSRDFAEAMKWYRKAAEQGFAKAQTKLGDMYAEGKGAPQEYAQAIMWYRKAADQGHHEAQTRIGDMYYKGDGVTQDYVEAHKWFNLAYTAATLKAPNSGWVVGARHNEVAVRMTTAQIAQAQKLAREWAPKISGRPDELAAEAALQEEKDRPIE